ncbi:hypothetical protein GCM10011591_08890 [Nocardia camponoti]|uniref:Serpin domain-containing protein n=1 Tax=Nocardia camponoti TaxID=1616106 RepID=A0A917QAB2_9NOCA|nr:hypothetical protein GCM10011591_08890 [Nocardia camponoti]
MVSGVGLWPLLAILAGAAQGDARAELAAAVGVSADAASQAGVDALRSLDLSFEAHTALGAWVRSGIPLNTEWVDSLPAGTVEELTDQAALDAWAAKHTAGLIKAFPVQVTEQTLFVIASALVAKTRWVKPFGRTATLSGSGDWAGHQGAGLHRTTYDKSVALLDDTVTRVIVRGGLLDVHLLVSDDGPQRALAAGFAALADAADVRTDFTVDTTGPCLRVARGKTTRGDAVNLTVPAFEVASLHDLTEHKELFGLTALTRPDPRGHLPGISPVPLMLDQAKQDVIARFDAEGFEAAAVTALAMTPGSVPYYEWATIVSVELDRPFGFLAVDRKTGLVIVAGQVAEPPREWERTDASASRWA